MTRVCGTRGGGEGGGGVQGALGEDEVLMQCGTCVCGGGGSISPFALHSGIKYNTSGLTLHSQSCACRRHNRIRGAGVCVRCKPLMKQGTHCSPRTAQERAPRKHCTASLSRTHLRVPPRLRRQEEHGDRRAGHHTAPRRAPSPPPPTCAQPRAPTPLRPARPPPPPTCA